MALLNKKNFLILLVLGMVICSCKKSEWLDVKRIKSDVKPETLKDFQALLDNNGLLNSTFTSSSIAGTDNIYVTSRDFPSVSQKENRLYTWQGDPWSSDGNVTSEWFYYYAMIEYANIALDGLADFTPSPEVNNVKGQAYFFRAIALSNLSALFCRQYDPNTAVSYKGLPVRLTSDVTQIVQRSSLSDTYIQIVKDCDAAISNLSDTQIATTRPSKLAAYGLLAKVYLYMGNYPLALKNAEQEISQYPNLLDFNNPIINQATTYRFPTNGIGNDEILFYSFGATSVSLAQPSPVTRANADTTLYRLYEANDLRKLYFFSGNDPEVKFRGGYTGGPFEFCGIANNEIYLIKAECEARLGQLPEAMATLNSLLAKRYASGSFTDREADNATDALDMILMERRKELPFTSNTRWEDLKRLNKEGRQIRLKRVINNTEYILEPNSPRYALPIPLKEIAISGIEQNDY